MQQGAIVVPCLMVFDRVIQGASRDQMGLCQWLNYHELLMNLRNLYNVHLIIFSVQSNKFPTGF